MNPHNTLSKQDEKASDNRLFKRLQITHYSSHRLLNGCNSILLVPKWDICNNMRNMTVCILTGIAINMYNSCQDSVYRKEKNYPFHQTLTLLVKLISTLFVCIYLYLSSLSCYLDKKFHCFLYFLTSS